MKKFFHEDSLKIVEALSFTKTLYAFDFDGTLSRIVREPAAATIGEAVNESLERLSKFAYVAVISGRSVEDLRSRLKFKPPYLIGNHGLEGLGTRNEVLTSAKKICLEWKQSLLRYAVFQSPGVEIEDKSFSIALHYRKSPTKKASRLKILEAISALSPQPRIIPGKSVINILPAGAPHKGVALVELMLQLGSRSAFYIGDDDTDEDVFSLPNPRILSVRVGQKRNSQAQYYIDSQTEVLRLLKTLVRFHERK